MRRSRIRWPNHEFVAGSLVFCFATLLGGLQQKKDTQKSTIRHCVLTRVYVYAEYSNREETGGEVMAPNSIETGISFAGVRDEHRHTHKKVQSMVL